MENLNYKRFFAFGCSFTDYRWPTWADIIGYSFGDNYYNYGSSSSSNQMIIRSIIEANLVHKFTKDDLIIVMWTDVLRDEHYSDWEFRGKGSEAIRKMKFDNDLELDKFTLDYFVRDMLYLQAAATVLDSTEATYFMTSIVPLNLTESIRTIHIPKDIKLLFSTVLNKLTPSFLDVVYKGSWDTHPHVKLFNNGDIELDSHPTPALHLEFVNKTWPSIKLADDIGSYVNLYEEQVCQGFSIDECGHLHDKKHIKRIS